MKMQAHRICGPDAHSHKSTVDHTYDISAMIRSCGAFRTHREKSCADAAQLTLPGATYRKKICNTVGEPPHPVIVAIRDNKDYIRVLLYSYYTTNREWGVLLSNTWQHFGRGATVDKYCRARNNEPCDLRF